MCEMFTRSENSIQDQKNRKIERVTTGDPTRHKKVNSLCIEHKIHPQGTVLQGDKINEAKRAMHEKLKMEGILSRDDEKCINGHKSMRGILTRRPEQGF